jgi:hypothetical protein
MIRAALAAVLALSACTAPPPAVIETGRAGTTLYAHPGGGVASVPADLWYRPGPFAVLGDCPSACTSVLMRDDLCTGPDATWRFHGPRMHDATPPAVRAAYVAQVAGWYRTRPDLSEWFLSGDLDPWRVKTGREMNAEHGVPLCGEGA